MPRASLLLTLTIAIIAADVFVRAGAAAHWPAAPPVPQASASPQPLILQEDDGDYLVRRTGPTAGSPYIIKLDPQFGNTQDFFVMAETLAPGQTIPFHKHDNAEEILLFEEGGATVIVGDESGAAGPRSIVFIPRNTWISATNASTKETHVIAVFSRHGFDRYMRAISVKQGEPVTPLTPEELTRLRTLGHATYWDPAKGPYPPGVAHP